MRCDNSITFLAEPYVIHLFFIYWDGYAIERQYSDDAGRRQDLAPLIQINSSKHVAGEQRLVKLNATVLASPPGNRMT